MNENKNNNIIAIDSESCEHCWLNNFSAFKNCPSEIQSKFLLNREVKEYDKREYLVKTGEPVSGVYCIQKGIVKISKRGNRNKEFIVWIAGKGDIVGLNSFINDEIYSFSASAIDDVTACFVPSSDLKMLLNKDPIVFVQLTRKLCQKLNFIEHRITSISRKSIREQCAEILISIATQSNSEDDKNFYINYSVNDLASLVGTTKNYLYKILLELTRREILAVSNKKLVINNMNVLSLIASGNDK